VGDAVGADLVAGDVPAVERRVATRAQEPGDRPGAAVADDVVAEQEPLDAVGVHHGAEQRADAVGADDLLAEVEAAVDGQGPAVERGLALDAEVALQVAEQRIEVGEAARDHGLGLGLE
jgi:hypothetical protein